jgi:hypothetical protein
LASQKQKKKKKINGTVQWRVSSKYTQGIIVRVVCLKPAKAPSIKRIDPRGWLFEK